MSRASILVFILVAACSKSDHAKPSSGSATGSGSAAASGSASGSASFDSGLPDGRPALRTDGTPDGGPGDQAGSGSGSAAAFNFDDLSDDEKAKFMRDKVVPAMKPAFKAFDAKDFAKFNCKTCHGKGAISKEYDMPNPDLPKLDFAELKAGKHAEMAKFMKDTVTPKMAELLGQPVHSPANPDGFGCLECHEQKK